jgi:hypothetical protein
MIRTNIPTILKNEIDRERFKLAVHDLGKLNKETFQGINVATLLYLYNLVSTDGLFIPGSFGSFFENIETDRSNPIVDAYINFIKKISDDNNRSEEYDQEELVR